MMKSSQKSQSYSAEFRESAVKLAVENKQSKAATARELGINVNTLHTWIQKYHQVDQEALKQVDDLKDEGKTVSKARVLRLMKQAGLQSKHRKRFKATTD